jgi:hypothetical protein
VSEDFKLLNIIGDIVAYLVTRTIKGHQYLYLQEGHREGDKVLIKYRYLGAVSGINKGTSQKIERHIDALAECQASKENILEILKAPGISEQEINKKLKKIRTDTNKITDKVLKIQPPLDLPPKIKINANLKRFNISDKPLQRDYETVWYKLKKAGVTTTKIPRFSFDSAFSSKVKTDKLRGNKISITLPWFWEKKGRANEFRQEYRKALGGVVIDSLKSDNPELFKQMKGHLKQSHKSTQEALISYFNATIRHQHKALSVKLFGTAPKATRLKPSELGLVEYGKRRTWEEEFKAVFAHMMRFGFQKSNKQAEEIFFKTMQMVKKKEEELSATLFLFRPKVRAELRRLQARKKAQGEMLDKISVISYLLK